MDFFLRDGDEQKARNAVHMDDLDLVMSRLDGALVAVAVKHGLHVCWTCGHTFDESTPKLRTTEVKTGLSRILLHAGCVKRSDPSHIYENHVRGLQTRRFFARAIKPLADAATAVKNRIVG